MIRFSILTMAVLPLIAGCIGPVETRIQTQMISALVEQKQYTFTKKPEQQSEIYNSARKLVGEELSARGLTQNDGGLMLVHVTLAVRPASIEITAGEHGQETPITLPKKRRFLQPCEDKEHRLTVAIVNQSNGEQIYTGSASEYHCKGIIGDSLPHLVKAALADLGSDPQKTAQNRTQTRSGVE